MTKLKITCPYCSARLDLLQALAGEDLRELVELLAGFGSARAAVVAYIELFKRSSKSSMSVARRLKLARELRKLWDSGRFSFERNTYAVNRDLISDALNEVIRVKKGPCNFRDHNYLKMVMVSLCRKAEIKAETTREEQRRTGAHRPQKKTVQIQPPSRMTLEEQAVAYASGQRMKQISGASLPYLAGIEVNLQKAGVDIDLLKQAALGDGRDWDGKQLLEYCREG